MELFPMLRHGSDAIHTEIACLTHSILRRISDEIKIVFAEHHRCRTNLSLDFLPIHLIIRNGDKPLSVNGTNQLPKRIDNSSTVGSHLVVMVDLLLDELFQTFAVLHGGETL